MTKFEIEQAAVESRAVTVARIAETLVALANARGGTLLLGVHPDTGQPEGLDDAEVVLDRALQSALSIEPPLIVPLPRILEMEGKQVVSVAVPAGLPHVYSYRGKYLTREAGRNRPLPPAELRRLMMARGVTSFESLVADGAEPLDLDWDKVERYLARLGFVGPAPEEALLQRGCLARQNMDFWPTFAGLLLFGRDAQRWVRSASILIVRYAGTTMRDSFAREEVVGTLPDQIRRAEAFVVGNLPKATRLSGLERIEETEYPAGAVREAIVNAVAHRDYQIQGDEIRILIFSDRIEFYSPGRLPGHVTVHNLEHERFSRNEIIVQVLSDLGFIERLGYGIDRMIRLMADAGLPPPHFEERPGGFLVTLFGHTSRSLRSQGEPLSVLDRTSAGYPGLNERQLVALTYLREKNRITNREFQELCPEVSDETIRRDLSDLVERNLLLKIGDKRATYYILK
jgi:ATP-dependent DNA helicase RecG